MQARDERYAPNNDIYVAILIIKYIRCCMQHPYLIHYRLNSALLLPIMDSLSISWQHPLCLNCYMCRFIYPPIVHNAYYRPALLNS